MTSDTTNLQSQISKRGIYKQPFSLKNNSKDGLLLKVHHTVRGSSGDLVCCRFLHAAFNENGEQLAVVDHAGCIFIIDLSSQKFWMLPAGKICCCISYSAYRKNEIIVGRNNCSLDFINAEDGSQVGNLIGHKLPPTQISYANGIPYCLTASSEEAIIWDLRSDSPLHQLTRHTNVSVKQALFMPVTNNILMRFQNDIIHIWKFHEFECIQQVIQKDWKCKEIRSLAFTRNGRAMAVAGQSATVSVFSVDTWSLIKIISLPDTCSGVKYIEFIPQLFDGGANKILGVLSTSCTVHLIDTESCVHIKRIILPEGCISDFLCSNTGKYVACLLKTGEVNIYCTIQLLSEEQQTVLVSDLTNHANRKPGQNCPYKIRAKQQLTKVHQQINDALDLHHLKPLLKEFGEYPESFRPLIWKTLLHLPDNQDAYVSLVNKGLHPSVVHLDKTYPLRNKYLLSSLKRLLSCLAHWCSLLGEAKYLPVFVLPFLKLFKNDQFVCFEVVISIIVNWCQFWFEFFPLPPANILIIIENLISEHDFELLQHFYKYNVTPALYAWSILETAFSEVFRGRAWLQLWDHILSNHPAFLLIVVAALNITCRTTLLKLTSTYEFENFYHSDIVINIKTLVSKAYDLWSKTQNEYHPKNFLKHYQPLACGNIYQMFDGYPKSLFDKQIKKMSAMRDEERSLLSSQQEVIKKMEEQEYLRLKEREVSEQQAKLKDLEEAYATVMKEEEDRIAEQRQKLSIMQRSLRDQQKQMLHESCLRSKSRATMERIEKLDKLIDNIDAHEETLDLKEETRRHCEQLVDCQKNIESQQPMEITLYNTQLDMLRNKQESLVQKLNSLFEAEAKAHPDNKIELKFYITMAERLLQTVESELTRTSSGHQNCVELTHRRIKVLVAEIETLNQEIQLLLKNQKANNLQEESNKSAETKVLSHWALFDGKVDNSVYSATNYSYKNAKSNAKTPYNNDFYCIGRFSVDSSSSSNSGIPASCEKKIQRGMRARDKSLTSTHSKKKNYKNI